MTWTELAAAIARMTDEQRQDDVTVLVQQLDEYLPASLSISSEDTCDTLDPNTFYLEV